MVPMWNGSLVREIESQRPPEIFDAETSTRSQGTSQKDLILSERDECQGRSYPNPNQWSVSTLVRTPGAIARAVP